MTSAGKLLFIGSITVVRSRNQKPLFDEHTDAGVTLDQMPHNLLVVEPIKYDERLFRHLGLDSQGPDVRRLYRVLQMGVMGAVGRDPPPAEHLRSIVVSHHHARSKKSQERELSEALANPQSHVLLICRVAEAEEAAFAQRSNIAKQRDFLERLYRDATIATGVADSLVSTSTPQLDSIWLKRLSPGVYLYRSFARDLEAANPPNPLALQ